MTEFKYEWDVDDFQHCGWAEARKTGRPCKATPQFSWEVLSSPCYTHLAKASPTTRHLVRLLQTVWEQRAAFDIDLIADGRRAHSLGRSHRR